MAYKKKILLIVPPVTVTRDRANFNLTFPIGLAYIAAVLEEASYEVIILDTIAENVEQENPVRNNPDLIQIGMTFEEIKNFIAECSPDFVGISSTFSTQSKNAYSVAEMVKSVNKGTPVIFGGAYATAEPEKVLENKNVDMVVLGEGEMAIAPLLKAIENGNNLELKTLKIIHGKGKSRLKHEVYTHLKTNPLIISFHDASPDSGSWGATIIELK